MFIGIINMCVLKKKFGKRIKYYRELNGLTQEQLAELIDINCRSLSFIERGVNFVKAETIEKICNALMLRLNSYLTLNTVRKTRKI